MSMSQFATLEDYYQNKVMELGVNSHDNGISIESNPFELGSVYFELFQNGWRKAKLSLDKS